MLTCFPLPVVSLQFSEMKISRLLIFRFRASIMAFCDWFWFLALTMYYPMTWMFWISLQWLYSPSRLVFLLPFTIWNTSLMSSETYSLFLLIYEKIPYITDFVVLCYPNSILSSVFKNLRISASCFSKKDNCSIRDCFSPSKVLYRLPLVSYSPTFPWSSLEISFS